MSIDIFSTQETDMDDFVGSIVNINVYDDLRFEGKLTNHKPHLYQVTAENNHFVFWEYDIIALHLEKSNNRLTIFI